jgi:catechol 2,3-dioxygenase-like lactoylglutathione lyase family enzyme
MVESLDGLHHVGTVVSDMERSAEIYRRVFGWEIVAREELLGDAAATNGLAFGIEETVSRIRLVMLGPPGGARAYTEFVQIEAAGLDISEKYQGLQVQALRVRDGVAAWEQLLAAGGIALRQPEEVVLDGWRTLVATARIPGGVIIELMEFRR